MDDFSWFITDFEEYLDEERDQARNESSNSQVDNTNNLEVRKQSQVDHLPSGLDEFSFPNSSQNYSSSSVGEVPIKPANSNAENNPLKLIVPIQDCQYSSQETSPLLNTRPEVPKELLTPEETKMVVATGMSSGGLVRVQRGWSEESGYRSASLEDPTSPSGDSEVSITELMSSSSLGRTCVPTSSAENPDEEDSEIEEAQSQDEEDELVLVPSGK